MLKTSFLLSDVYISVYDTKDMRNVSSQKELMYLIVLKYVASSVCMFDNNNKHF